MTTPAKITHAAILAGGRSSRMGTDKALLQIAGISMLERIARTASALFPTLLIVGRPTAPPNWPADLTATFLADDAPEFSGPLAGLIRALEYVAAPVLLLACDTPLLTAPTISALLSAHAASPPNTLATLATSKDADNSIYAEPTFSIYTPAFLPELKKMLAADHRSFQPLLHHPHIHTHPIPPESVPELLNINDPQSLAQATQLLTAIK